MLIHCTIQIDWTSSANQLMQRKVAKMGILLIMMMMVSEFGGTELCAQMRQNRLKE